MTGFIGPQVTSLGMAGVGANDDVLQPVDYRVAPPMKRGGYSLDYRVTADYLWPRSSFLGSLDGVAPGPPIGDNAAHFWEWDFLPTGGHVPKKVIGQTVNGSGAPVSGATVMLFNTSTNLNVDVQTTDAGGNYQLSDPNATTNFVVAYLPGSPDVAGTTIDELTGI